MDALAAYRGKRVFVTGHTGFKGRWLCEWLRMLGCSEVHGSSLPDSDIREPMWLAGMMEHDEPEIIFHLAAQALVRKSYADPLGTYSTNVQGTANVLQFAPKGARIVCVTSDKVYAGSTSSFGNRETDRLGGVDPYSASKAAAEMVIASYRDGFGLNVCSARAGNCIGGGDTSLDRLIPDIIRARESGKPLIVRNPEASRPWQHVLEPLYGYLLLGISDIREPFNFGPAESHTVREVLALCGAQWSHEPAKISESQSLSLNSQKAADVLGWRPRWSFERAIEETMKGYAGARMEDQIETYMES